MKRGNKMGYTDGAELTKVGRKGGRKYKIYTVEEMLNMIFYFEKGMKSSKRHIRIPKCMENKWIKIVLINKSL